MLSVRNTALLSATALLLGTAFAQDDPAVPARPGDGPAEQAGQDDGFYRASEILGMTVRSDDGQDLGQIQDLLIERRNQRIRYFLLGEGGELNAQSNLRVVPWTAARPHFEEADRFVTVRVDQQRWQQAPSFTFQEIQAGPAAWTTEVDRFYGVGGRSSRGQRPDVEVEQDGDVEGRNRPRDRAGRNRGDAEVETEGANANEENVEIEGREGNIQIEGRNRQREGARANPNGVQIQGEEGGVNIRPNGQVEIQGDNDPNN